MLDQVLLYGNDNYNHDTSKKILLSTITFVLIVKDLKCPYYRIFFYVK